MLDVEDWAEIRRLHRAEGLSIKAIVRVTGVARNTVRAALASDGPPKYERAQAGSIVDAVEPQIRELLRAFPMMPATVIGERIGWTRSIRVLSARVAELRPVYLPPDPAGRTSYEAGELCQNDFWFPEVTVPVGFGQVRTAKELPVLTMVTGYSRWLSAVLVPSRAAEDLFAGWWQLLSALGGVPRLLVWDGEGAVGRHERGSSRHSPGTGKGLTAQAHAFRGVLASRIYVCAPRDPEAKGLVERANGYLETSFLPGRTFASPADFNAQLTGWLAVVNARRRRALGCAPTERVGADRAAMIALPPLAPVTAWRSSLRLPRDHYVRFDSNDYSVHPGVIGRRIEVIADLQRLQVFCDGRLVANHPRAWARHQTLSDPEHVAAADLLRQQHRPGRPRTLPAGEVEQRSLTDYDTVFGLGDDAANDMGDSVTGDGTAEGGAA